MCTPSDAGGVRVPVKPLLLWNHPFRVQEPLRVEEVEGEEVKKGSGEEEKEEEGKEERQREEEEKKEEEQQVWTGDELEVL